MMVASLIGFAGSAGATATVDLIWTATSGTGAGVGTSSIDAASGDTLTLAILLTAGTEGISSYGISVSFDPGALDQLNVTSATEFGLKPTITCSPFPSCFFDSPTMSNFTPGVSGIMDSSTVATGFVYTFEAGTLGSGLLDTFGAFQIGEIVFSANSSTATTSLAAGFFVVGVDAAYDNGGLPVVTTFNGAAADVFGPEPGTATLLGLGLVGLAVAGRRSRD
jgi:hypothetical protein